MLDASLIAVGASCQIDTLHENRDVRVLTLHFLVMIEVLLMLPRSDAARQAHQFLDAPALTEGKQARVEV